MTEDALSPEKPTLWQRIVGVLHFCRNFIELAVIIGVLWWLAIPYYGELLARFGGGILRYALDVPIAAGYVVPEGVLNTQSFLVLIFSDDAGGNMAGHELRFPIALLITNMAPYLALVLATPRLGMVHRIVTLIVGAGIIFIGHLGFVVGALYFREQIAQAPDIPTALVQLYLTLPFVLWIVLAYWGKIARYLTDDDSAAAHTGEG